MSELVALPGTCSECGAVGQMRVSGHVPAGMTFEMRHEAIGDHSPRLLLHGMELKMPVVTMAPGFEPKEFDGNGDRSDR